MLDLRTLATELDDLRDSRDADEEYDKDRLRDLEALEGELGDLHIASRRHTFIAEYDWENYARDLAEDQIGASHEWPLDCIDWEKAAEELQVGYTSVDFDGETYWYRA
jgi:hypothetical protein